MDFNKKNIFQHLGRNIAEKESDRKSIELIGTLPEWDLTDLYMDQDAPEIGKDIKNLCLNVKSFSKDYQGNLKTLSASEMLKCIKRNEEISNLMGRLGSYAGLRYYQRTTDPVRSKFLARIQEEITRNSSELIFFSLEFNQLEEEHLSQLLAENKDLAKYSSAFKRMRALKPYQLSDELEKFLNDQSIVGASAWNRLFDETMASLQFKLDKKEVALETVLNKLTDRKRTERKKAAKSLAKVLTKNLPLFTRITNTLVKEKSIEDKWRNFPSPEFSRHLSNDIEPTVVNALRNAVVDNYPNISHRYYRLKAKWLGLKKLEIWDRNAPLKNDTTDLISWSKAKELVLSAYKEFDPRLEKLAKPFFQNGWIDAEVKPGKAPGAFAHPTVTNVHPYILLNYLGKPRDVMTLAHELGHGIHQTLAAKQGEILASTPLTLAETASVFGEMLTFKKMLSESQGEAERHHLLAAKVEDMINTVIRQISFYDFETRLHNERLKGELTPDEINKIWISVSKESLGNSFNFMSGYETFWAYVPHFVHSPFYVYAYAFGDGLVNSLYSVYESSDSTFQDKYLKMLEAGGSKHHKELLKPFNLNASDSTFWHNGLKLISSMIDELETMET